MIQQIATQNVQMDTQQPAGCGKTQDSGDGTFQSMMQAAVQKSDPGQTRQSSASSSDRPDEKTAKKSGEKAADTTDGQQAQTVSAQQNASVALVPAGLQLPKAPQQTDTTQTAEAGTAVPQVAGLLSAKEQSTLPQTAAELLSASQQKEGGGATAVLSGQKTQRSGQIDATPQDPGGKQEAAAPTTEQKELPSAGSDGKSVQTPPDFSAKDERGQSAKAPTPGQISATGPTDSAETDSLASASPSGTQQSADSAKVKFSAETGSGQLKTGPAKQPDSPASNAGAQNLSHLYDSGNVVIKVSGEAATAQSAPAHQVASFAANQIQSGKSEFQMDLYPQSLGKVSVKLTAEKGLLTVEIAASDPKTQSMLASGSGEIRSILQSSTGQNVQTVFPNQQAAQWYGQPQDGGGDADSGQQREKQEQKKKAGGAAPVKEVGLNTGDFLALIRQFNVVGR